MIKKLTTLLLCATLTTTAAASEQTCEVKVCNKLERFSLDIWSHVKDHMGEVCFDVVLPKKESYVGNVLSSDSKWYQGSSINITKQSVTKVKQVYSCSVTGKEK